MTSEKKTGLIKIALLVIFGPLSLVVGFLHLVYIGILFIGVSFEPSLGIVRILAPLAFISHLSGIACFWWAMTTKRTFSINEILLIIVFVIFETATAWWFGVMFSTLVPKFAQIPSILYEIFPGKIQHLAPYILPIGAAVIFGLLMFVLNKKHNTELLE